MSKKKIFICGLMITVLMSAVLFALLKPKSKLIAQTNEKPTEVEDIQPSPEIIEVTPEIIGTLEPEIITPSLEVIEESLRAILETPNPWPTKKPAPEIVEIDPKGMYVEERFFDFQYALKDTYKSNIQIEPGDLHMTDVIANRWFHPTPINDGNTLEDFQMVCYAILTYYETYYDSEVLCDYYYDFYDDVVKYDPAISTMLYEVVVHGERPLHICIDAYNYRINVQEIDDAEIEYLKSLNLDKTKQ